jgi:hypothetical protein
MKPKNLIAGLLLCISLFACASGPTVHRAGKYMWVEGVPGMYTDAGELQAAASDYWTEAEAGKYGGPPTVWAWSPQGMAVSAAIANGIRAAKCGR